MAAAESRAETLKVGKDRRTIQVLRDGPGPGAPDAPSFVWLGGYRSDMAGGKATALAAWGSERGVSVTRFDYSGHGISPGDFEAGTLSRWLEEAEAVLAATPGRHVLVGSSMGGWMALKAAERAARTGAIQALLLVAPAWNMASLMWSNLSRAQREVIIRDGVLREPGAYGTYVVTRDLIEDGRALEWGKAPVELACPVRILQGGRDTDVPTPHVLALIDAIEDEDVRLTLIKDGDHRLSRDEDVALLLRAAGELAGRA